MRTGKGAPSTVTRSLRHPVSIVVVAPWAGQRKPDLGDGNREVDGAAVYQSGVVRAS
jgi:hypothetical protein